MANIKYTSIKSDIREFLNNDLGPFLTDITHGGGEHEPSTLMGQQLFKSFETYYNLKEKLDHGVLRCAFLALAKSGKSTLLNSFLGASILPTSNVPETARIVSIEHANVQQPTLTYRADGEEVKVIGESNIRVQLRMLNDQVRIRRHRKEDENLLNVKTEIVALPAADAEEVQLRLLDTPGPNEAGEDALRHQVERLLDTVDAVVYILDVTKLKTVEEASLLAKLQKSNPQLVQRLAQRLFFVVNKIDQMDEVDCLPEDELREYVANLITSQMKTEAFQLSPDQVLFVSAHEALLARLVLQGKASAKELQMFSKRAWGRIAMNKQHTEAEYKESAKAMLEASRLPQLEGSLLTYLYNHAGGLKLVSLLDDIISLLTEIQNVALTGQAALKQTASQLEQEIRDLNLKLTATLGKFGNVQAVADRVEADVVDNVQFRMQTLRERLFDHVAEVLDTNSEPNLPAVKTGRWRSVFEKACRFVNRNTNVESDSDAQLKETLEELHIDINQQIEAEIGEFWHDLEVSTNEKQREIIGTINGHLQSLARDIEGVVGAALDLELRPTDISLDPPSAQEFHNTLEDLFATGIGQSTRTENSVCEEEYVAWDRRYRGLCRTTEYYVARPAKRTVQSQHEVTIYQLQPEKIKEYFSNMVATTVDNSVRHVRSFVHGYMSKHINEARDRISKYGQRYGDTMLAALEAKSRSAEQQEAGVHALKQHLATVEKLLGKSREMSERADLLAPEPSDPGFCWVPDMEGNDMEGVISDEEGFKQPVLDDAKPASEVLDSARDTPPAPSKEKTAHPSGEGDLSALLQGALPPAAPFQDSTNPVRTIAAAVQVPEGPSFAGLLRGDDQKDLGVEVLPVTPETPESPGWSRRPHHQKSAPSMADVFEKLSVSATPPVAPSSENKRDSQETAEGKLASQDQPRASFSSPQTITKVENGTQTDVATREVPSDEPGALPLETKDQGHVEAADKSISGAPEHLKYSSDCPPSSDSLGVISAPPSGHFDNLDEMSAAPSSPFDNLGVLSGPPSTNFEALGLHSAAPSSTAPTSPYDPITAVLSPVHQVHEGDSDSDSDAHQDLRESAMMRADSHDSDWEHVDAGAEEVVA